MPDLMDWLLEALDPELHHDVQALAAQAGVSTQEISGRLLRLGLESQALLDLDLSVPQRTVFTPEEECPHGMIPRLCSRCWSKRKAQEQVPEGDPDD